MILSHVIRGLGNQMFYTLLGGRLPNQRGFQFYIDVRDFEGYGSHKGYGSSRVFGGILIWPSHI